MQRTLLGFVVLGVVACSGGDDTAGRGGGDSDAAVGPEPICTEPIAVPCSDQVIQQMSLQQDPAPGIITNEVNGEVFVSHVDATAGGAFATTPDAYVYGRFSEAGLEKVGISDYAAIDSMEWDIAFRRYVVRINSGHSGPSCVTAARLPGTPVFGEVSEVPEGPYKTDEYFTASCEIIPDGSGLPNSPATALSSYWTYPGCVQMTDNVYVLELASARHVKLTVESYYEPGVQEQCDTTDAVPQGDTGSANFVVRWAWLD